MPLRTIEPVAITWPWLAVRRAIAAFCSTSKTLVPFELIWRMIAKIFDVGVSVYPQRHGRSPFFAAPHYPMVRIRRPICFLKGPCPDRQKLCSWTLCCCSLPFKYY